MGGGKKTALTPPHNKPKPPATAAKAKTKAKAKPKAKPDADDPGQQRLMFGGSDNDKDKKRMAALSAAPESSCAKKVKSEQPESAESGLDPLVPGVVAVSAALTAAAPAEEPLAQALADVGPGDPVPDATATTANCTDTSGPPPAPTPCDDEGLCL